MCSSGHRIRWHGCWTRGWTPIITTRIQEVGSWQRDRVLWEGWGIGDHEAKGLHVTGLSPCLPETPLTLAAQTEGSVEVIRTLCLGGAHIDFRARDGMTALHKAACARHCLALTVRFQILPGPSPEPRDTPE